MGFGYYYVFYFLYFFPIFLITGFILYKKRSILTSKMIIIASLITIYFAFYYFHALKLGSDIFNTRSPQGGYRLADFVPGNALELITWSFPNLGYDWVPNYRAKWALISFDSKHMAYSFICAFGLFFLLHLKSPLKNKVILLLIFCIAFQYLFLVSGFYSPLINFLVLINSSITEFNHYNDLGFRAGTSILIIFLIGFGFQYAVQKEKFSQYLYLVYVLITAPLLALNFKFNFINLYITTIYLIFSILLYFSFKNKKYYLIAILLFCLNLSIFLLFASQTIYKNSKPIEDSYIVTELYKHKIPLNQTESMIYSPKLAAYKALFSQINATELNTGLRYYPNLKFIGSSDVQVRECDGRVCLSSADGMIDGFLAYASKFSIFILINIAFTILILIWLGYLLKAKKFTSINKTKTESDINNN